MGRGSAGSGHREGTRSRVAYNGASPAEAEDDRDAAAGPRLGFHARFVLRRIERVAGDPNAVLIAMALGLGILDLAGTTGRLLALPAARSEREESARPGLSGGSSRHAEKVCIADLCRRLIVRCSIKA